MRRHTSAESGFTLVEVLVAMTLVLVLVRGAAGMLLVAVRLAEGAREQTFTATLASAKVEELQPALPAVAGGSLEADIDGFADFIDAGGRIVGRGGRPPDALYVRRWTLAPLGPSFPGTWVLRVRVASVVQADAPAGRSPQPRRPNETWLTTLIEGAA